VDPSLQQSLVRFVRASRPDEPGAPDFITEWVEFGASPRAAQALSVASRARALLHGRDRVLESDVVALAPDIVRHRLVLNYHAAAEQIRAVDLVRRLLALHFETANVEAPDARPLWRRLLRLQ
jgi:MoxR-like ATPase